MARVIDPNLIIDTPDAYDKAKGLAKYSTYTCIAWQRRSDGQRRWARTSAITIKQAMLDVGTQGEIYFFTRRPGLHRLNWWIANNIRRQCVSGWHTR